jgi:hypothetical protein
VRRTGERNSPIRREVDVAEENSLLKNVGRNLHG